MYQLNQVLPAVHGVGEQLTNTFAKKNWHTVLDFLLNLPLRYEDRSQIYTIAQLKNLDSSYLVPETADDTVESKKNESKKSQKQFFTIIAEIKDYRQYYKGRLLIARAKLVDSSGEIAALWFNNKFLKNQLQAGEQYYVSGALKNGSLIQAKIEKLGQENLHTARLVPIYGQLGKTKQGKLRRLQQEILNDLKTEPTTIQETLKNIHFPEKEEDIVNAREKLAIEELLYLINKAKNLKEAWQNEHQAPSIKIVAKELFPILPFKLTRAQQRACEDIRLDLGKKQGMNRLLIGDVGSGKTVVAGIAAWHVCQVGRSVALVAPTQILAEQHFRTLEKLFPQLKLQLVTGKTSREFKLSPQTCYVGTHALINRLSEIEPALIIYDEQQRFGTRQRQIAQAHVLTMTATPIPRSLMLTIFAHLDISLLDEMPRGREMATTWLVPQHKQADALTWLVKELTSRQNRQAIIVCPFIDPSQHQALENVAAVKAVFERLANDLVPIYQRENIPAKKKLELGLLHARLSKKEQASVIEAVYAKKVQLLVSTPMVEVGVDLPNADIIVIQGAERFGLASLHQLRGRVGRAGQTSYCLLFTSPKNQTQTNTKKSETSSQRLKVFCQEKDGFKLAELDLKQRGAGDIFGTAQSGFNQLQFASWTNVDLIQQAKKISEKQINHLSWLTAYFDKRHLSQEINNN